MTVKVYIDGTVHGPKDARISVFDRGFLYGDSVYEVVRTAGGHPVDFEPHLDRLDRSAAALALALPPRTTIVDACARTRLTVALPWDLRPWMRVAADATTSTWRTATTTHRRCDMADKPEMTMMVPVAAAPAERRKVNVARA